MHDHDLSELIMAWGRGWAVSRETAAPVAVAGGFHIAVNHRRERGRHVLHTWTADSLAAVARDADEPLRWIKIAGPAAELRAALPAKWSVVRTDHLMTAPLRPGRVEPAAPYRLAVESDGDLATVQVLTADGETAASARLGRSGGFAVFDQVVTSAGHRRRGLGTVAMSALADHAVRAGSHTGVLVASPDGRALYTTLGWRVVSDVPAAVIPD